MIRQPTMTGSLPRRLWSSIGSTALLVGVVVSPFLFVAFRLWQIANGSPAQVSDLLILLLCLVSFLVLLVVVQNMGPLKPAALVPFPVAETVRALVERSFFGVGPLVGFTAWNDRLGLERLVQPEPVESLTRSATPGDRRPSMVSVGERTTQRLSGASAATAATTTTAVAADQRWRGPTVTHVIERGDTYWTLAVRCFGQGSRWAEIRDLNVGRTVAEGIALSADDDLRRGWTIVIPDSSEREVS